MSGSRSVLVAFVGVLVFCLVAGAIYLEILTSARATQLAWEVTQPVAAGQELTTANVTEVRVPAADGGWDLVRGNLPAEHRRAAHGMSAGTVLFNSDLLQQDLALVTLTLKAPPPLGQGDSIDVYALVDGRTQMVGRSLIVDHVDGDSAFVWVPAPDEPAWITLEASQVALFAALSSGVGVPQDSSQSMAEALAQLRGGTVPGGGLPPEEVVPTPSAAPASSPSPTPTPRRRSGG
jgi:hypothetical protein